MATSPLWSPLGGSGPVTIHVSESAFRVTGPVTHFRASVLPEGTIQFFSPTLFVKQPLHCLLCQLSHPAIQLSRLAEKYAYITKGEKKISFLLKGWMRNKASSCIWPTSTREVLWNHKHETSGVAVFIILGVVCLKWQPSQYLTHSNLQKSYGDCISRCCSSGLCIPHCTTSSAVRQS